MGGVPRPTITHRHNERAVKCANVAGGVGVDARTGADTETLDDVEIFDGKRWRRATDGLDQPRRGANLVKIPVTRFRGRG